jgi:hypothetical protein
MRDDIKQLVEGIQHVAALAQEADVLAARLDASEAECARWRTLAEKLGTEGTALRDPATHCLELKFLVSEELLVLSRSPHALLERFLADAYEQFTRAWPPRAAGRSA